YFGLVAGASVLPPGEDSERLARMSALRALELDPTLPEAHAVLCAMAAALDHDWAEAERRFRLATAGGNMPPGVRLRCAINKLCANGRPHDAARQTRLALQDDPLNTFVVMQLGVCLHAAGDEDQAFQCFGQAVELDDKNWLARLNQGFWFLQRGQP